MGPAQRFTGSIFPDAKALQTKTAANTLRTRASNRTHFVDTLFYVDNAGYENVRISAKTFEGKAEHVLFDGPAAYLTVNGTQV